MSIFKESEFIDNELILMFTDKFSNNIAKLDKLIDNLNDTFLYEESLRELFRMFHSLKASSGFIANSDFLEIVKRVESVISILQKSPPPIDRRIFGWLLDVKSQFRLWLEEIDDKRDRLSELKKSLKETITISSTDNKNPKEILKDLVVLYVDNASVLDNKIAQIKDSVKEFFHIQDSKTAFEFVKKNLVNLIIVEPMNISGLNLIADVKSLKLNRPIIIYTALSSKDFERKAKMLGINHFLQKKIDANQFSIEILSLVYTFFCQKSIKITNPIIKNYIANLPPLPDTIFQIEKICADNDSSINDLVKVVKKDPVISTNILKLAQSPYFGFSNVNTIDKAVTLFGKSTTKALSFAGIMYKNFEFNLSCYSLSSVQFSNVSQMRAKLMIRWYSKVSFHKLVILATSALIGNLGQLVISKQLIERDGIDEFKKLISSKGVKDSELQMFNVTNQEVTSDILSYWNLETILSDSIRYSQNLNYAYEGVKPYAIANRVVFSLVDCLGRISSEIPRDIERLMIENNMDLAPLKASLNLIRGS